MISDLYCIYCKTPLRETIKKGNTQIFSCVKHEFPAADGIVYLKDNELSRKVVALIRENKTIKASLLLFYLPLHLSLPAKVLLSLNLPISFSVFVRVLRIFGYNKLWSRYLLKRKYATSFKLATKLTRYLKNGEKTLDFGCGVGQLLPGVSSRIRPENLYALDDSFLNLLIAKRFFTKKGTTFICSDGEKGLPFRDGFLKNVIATDSVHDINNKKYFVKESERVLGKNGRIFLTHIVSFNGKIYENVKGIYADKLLDIIKKQKFKKISVFTDQNLLNELTRKKVNLNKVETVQNKDEYTLLAAKKRFT